MSLDNTNALTTVSQVETDLGITPDSQTAKLEGLILDASDTIESRTSRQFRKEEVTEQLAGLGTVRLAVARTPIDTSAEVTITYDAVEVDSDTYEVEDAGAGFLRSIYGTWNWDANALPTIGVDPLPGTERKLYEVTYTGGYVLPNDTVGSRDLPRDLELACRQLVAQLYFGIGRDPSIVQEKVLSGSVTYQKGSVDSGPDSDLPPLTRAAVRKYRRVT